MSTEQMLYPKDASGGFYLYRKQSGINIRDGFSLEFNRRFPDHKITATARFILRMVSREETDAYLGESDALRQMDYARLIQMMLGSTGRVAAEQLHAALSPLKFLPPNESGNRLIVASVMDDEKKLEQERESYLRIMGRAAGTALRPDNHPMSMVIPVGRTSNAAKPSDEALDYLNGFMPERVTLLRTTPAPLPAGWS